ncbi:mannose-6-phosphate isomerase, class I [Vibrio maritimus]|uniref:mannose-6-phosphate isomerase, class I n=1 Tax=Vibrio maritimus TaxID=990268 RepID=UPI0037366A8D
MSLVKLSNDIKHYAWGSKTSITELFGIENPKNEPQAEIWMGAHANGSSVLEDSGSSLADYIASDKQKALGDYTTNRFGELPYLFKVLAAETPLSIQVHPNKYKSELGFERENAQGIPLDAANRNYKDPNHKPELVYALTFYKAMNGFRPIEDIVRLFETIGIDALEPQVTALANNQTSDGLKRFFTEIMSISGDNKQQALQELYAAYERPAKSLMVREALSYSQSFSQHYANDIGLFAPLMLNTVELAPGEAMFLHAETPHAYVEGTGLEIMASSDNVLRAGLTPKYIDVPELIDNVKFQPIKPEDIRLNPVNKSGRLSYPIPVDDFGFDIIQSNQEVQRQYLRSAEILFCVEGEVTVSSSDNQVVLKPGESVFISNDSAHYQYQGNGVLARAFN